MTDLLNIQNIHFRTNCNTFGHSLLIAIYYKLVFLFTHRAGQQIYFIKGLRPVLEGFVVTMHEGACETGSQIPRALARGIQHTVRTITVICNSSWSHLDWVILQHYLKPSIWDNFYICYTPIYNGSQLPYHKPWGRCSWYYCCIFKMYWDIKKQFVFNFIWYLFHSCIPDSKNLPIGID